MARPGRSQGELFTSRELALAAGLSARNFGLLAEQGVAPMPADGGRGRAGHRSYSGAALAQTALIGALHLAGFELLVSARLAAAFSKNFEESYGKLPSNLGIFLQPPLNPKPGFTPWINNPGGEHVDIEQDYWLHERLRNRSSIYQRNMAQDGDMIIEIADGMFVLTHVRGSENVRTFSPVTRCGLPASPDYRIVGRGSAAHIVPVHEELENLNYENPRTAEQLRCIEREYLDGRKHAVVVAKINVSLAIRNAFDRVQDDRANKRAT
jgi:hypothetical protein